MPSSRDVANATILACCATLIAACAAPSTAPTHGGDHVGAGRTVEVPALWAARTGESGIERARVTVGTVGEPGFGIDLADAEAEGAGPQWTAASASAAAVATIWSGVDPSIVDIRYEVTGPIDGPSAGGILTVGTLAGIRGEALDPKVTMTGTIAPDGAIGPVGGVSAKLRAAADAGFTTVLVPAGNLASAPGLVAEGTALGLTVTPIRTLLDAYRGFTGVALADASCDVTVDPAVVSAATTATLGAPPATAASLGERAKAVSAGARLLIDQATAEIAAGVDGLARDQLAALPALLAPVMRADMLARAVSTWAEKHPTDAAGAKTAEAMVAFADATVSTFPVSLAAWRALPPDVPIDPQLAQRRGQAYAVLLQTAATSTLGYLDAVLSLHKNKDAAPQTAILADLSLIARDEAAVSASSGLADTVLETAWALAAWTAEQQVYDVVALRMGASDAELGTRTASDLVHASACRVLADGLNPSWPVWSTKAAVDLASAAPADVAQEYWLAATATASEAQLALAMQTVQPSTK